MAVKKTNHEAFTRIHLNNNFTTRLCEVLIIDDEANLDSFCFVKISAIGDQCQGFFRSRPVR